MAHFTDCSFQGTTVVLDGNEYIGCKFYQCRIVVTRGNFTLKNSNFDSCAFEFGGEALNIRSLVLGLLGQPNRPKPAKEASKTTNTESQSNV